MNRDTRAKIAEQTLEILGQGHYLSPTKVRVSIAEELAAACAATRLYRPEDLPALTERLASAPRHPETEIRVSGVGTLEAARALEGRFEHVACLNFASAKNPGGGFRSGAQAQEESLARATGLFAALETQPAYYHFHRNLGTALYSDHIIFSPRLPVFRDAEEELLEAPWTTSILTAAAVNAGALRQNEPAKTGLIRGAMEQRTRGVLAVAAAAGCDALVLGAWGCGVFRNDPAEVAQIFAAALQHDNFRGLFRHVEFAILDRTPEQNTLRAFEKTFSASSH